MTALAPAPGFEERAKRSIARSVRHGVAVPVKPDPSRHYIRVTDVTEWLATLGEDPAIDESLLEEEEFGRDGWIAFVFVDADDICVAFAETAVCLPLSKPAGVA